ncbi:hypothetical protein V1525DRAFT_458823 [Lipomyces kononenkoae]|uniref:Uncharacterized protein n=1 Tax=Lipomyces kononenkoae TaxID=34357 RepID=A0ACC3SU40_LIPKO
MPRTPPRQTARNSVVITPPTPRYGPMFDPDHYDLLDRRQQKQKQKQQRHGDQHTDRQRSQWRRSSADAGVEDDGETARSRTRTRTISGAQPGIQVVTPRETPYRRRRQGELDLAATEEGVEDELSSTWKQKEKPVARVLFPSTPVQTATADEDVDGFGSGRTDANLKFRIYKDPEPEIDVCEDAEDDPFLTRPANKRRYQSGSLAGPDQSKKGMAFVFRGKKIFRTFPSKEECSDDEEFAIAPIKPRTLFPRATAVDAETSLDSSQPTSSSSGIFDDLAKDSSNTDLSTQESVCHQSDTDGGIHGGTVTRTTRGEASSWDSGLRTNPEEEETDIEDYYSA